MSRYKRIPGEPDQAAAPDDDAPQAAADQVAELQGRDAVRFETAEQAAEHFQNHPDIPRRAVMTREGWFVPADSGTPPIARGR